MRITNDALIQRLLLSAGAPINNRDENGTSQEVVVAVHVPCYYEDVVMRSGASGEKSGETIFYRSVRDKNETFSSLCQSIVEHDLLERRQILHFLAALHPVPATDDCVEQSNRISNSKCKQSLLTGYSLRYGHGFITLVKPTWRASLASSNDGVVKENYMEVNISLDANPYGSESKSGFELNWYEPIISAVHRNPELFFKSHTGQTINNCSGHDNPDDINKVIHLYFRSNTRIGRYGGHPFPATLVNARVLNLTEDENHVGAVAWYENLSLAEAVNELDADNAVGNANSNGVTLATHVIENGVSNGRLVDRNARSHFNQGEFSRVILAGSRLDFTLDPSKYLFVEDRIKRNEAFVGGVEERREDDTPHDFDGSEDSRRRAQTSVAIKKKSTSASSNRATAKTDGTVTAQSTAFLTATGSRTAKAIISNDKSASAATAPRIKTRNKRTNPTKLALEVLAMEPKDNNDAESTDLTRSTPMATNDQNEDSRYEHDKSNANSETATDKKAKTTKCNDTTRKAEAEASDRNISSGDTMLIVQQQAKHQGQGHPRYDENETDVIMNEEANDSTKNSKGSDNRKNETSSKNNKKGNLKSTAAVTATADKVATSSNTKPPASTAAAEKSTKRKRKKAASIKKASNVLLDHDKSVALVVEKNQKHVAGNNANKLSTAGDKNAANASIMAAEKVKSNKSNIEDHALNSSDIKQMAKELANQENLSHDSVYNIGMDNCDSTDKPRASIAKQKPIKPALKSKAEASKHSESKKRADSSSGKASKSNANDAAASPAKSHSPTKSVRVADTPSKTAEGFPEGWKIRRVKRAEGSKVDCFWFSPVNNYQFRSSKAARDFLHHLESCGGKEAVAWTLFTQNKKRKSKNQDSNADKSKINETKEMGDATNRAVSIDASENSLHMEERNASPPKKKKLKFNPVPKPKSSTEKKRMFGSQSSPSGHADMEDDRTSPHVKKSNKKTASKKKATSDENKPKRPLTSYIRFSNKIRSQVIEDNPGLTNQEVASRIGGLWRNLDAKEKKPFEDEAHEANARYLEAMKEYKTMKSASTDGVNVEGQQLIERDLSSWPFVLQIIVKQDATESNIPIQLQRLLNSMKLV